MAITLVNDATCKVGFRDTDI